MPVYEEKEKVNGQKRYYIRLYVEKANGKKQQITRHNKRWVGRDGKILAQQEEVRLKNKDFNDYEDMTVDEIANNYFENKKNEWSDSTYKKNVDNYKLHIKQDFGYKKASTITTKDILDWKNKKTKKDYTIKYLKNIYTTFSSIIEFGYKYFDIQQNVVKKVGNFKVPKNYKKKEMKFIDDITFNKAITNEKDFIYYVAFTLLFHVGLRRGEMLALNFNNDIDFDKCVIKIDETVNPKISKIPTPPKTPKSNRMLPVKKEIITLLKILISQYKDTNGYIFLQHITLTTLRRKSNNNLKAIGFNKEQYLRIHDYRHSFASKCINDGVPIEILSEYMGHENISITWDTYGHLYPEAKKTLLDRLNSTIIIPEKYIKQDQKQDQEK